MFNNLGLGYNEKENDSRIITQEGLMDNISIIIKVKMRLNT